MTKKNNLVYLEDVQTAIHKIELYTKEGERFFLKDGKTQDAVIQNLTVIGEATKKLPKSLTNKAADIPWKQIAGMRDILIHDYSATDIHTIWNTVTEDLPSLKQAIVQLIREYKD